jgi:hypothetical protein
MSRRSDSSYGHPAPRGRSTGLRGQLIVTIYRRGRLTRNVGYVLSVPLFTRVHFHSRLRFQIDPTNPIHSTSRARNNSVSLSALDGTSV